MLNTDRVIKNRLGEFVDRWRAKRAEYDCPEDFMYDMTDEYIDLMHPDVRYEPDFDRFFDQCKDKLLDHFYAEVDQ